jgi:hypothetical protein
MSVVEKARRADGCLDFAIAAGAIDAGRVNLFERWESQAAERTATLKQTTTAGHPPSVGRRSVGRGPTDLIGRAPSMLPFHALPLPNRG